MFAQLGSIVFENLKSFSDYNKKGSARYAEHFLLDGKPRLQRIGSALDEINLSIRLHASFCNPQQEVNRLKQVRDEGEVLPLLWGNGKIEGDFVVVDLTESKEDADQQGNAISFSVSLTLKEYVTPDLLHQMQHESRNAAKAVGDKKPVAKKKVNPATCPQTISGIISKIESHAAAINKIVLERGGIGTAENKAKINQHNAAIQLLCADLQARGADPASCANSYPQISENAGFVKTNASVFNLDLTRAPERVPNDNAETQRRVKNLKTAARPLINQSITRK